MPLPPSALAAGSYPKPDLPRKHRTELLASGILAAAVLLVAALRFGLALHYSVQ